MKSSKEVISKLFFLCPVPNDQKPLNEYIELKENPLTNWANISKKNYKSKISSLGLFFIIFFFCLPFTFAESFIEINQKNVFKSQFNNFLFIISFCSLFFLLNLVNWLELNKRFRNPELSYEEGSWYDGKIWKKPFSLMKNEKLISVQKIEPIIQQLKSNIFIGFFSFYSLFAVLFFLH
jgi:hypothetical protein